MKSVVAVPSFDTGEYEGSDFEMSEGGARLTIRAASIPPFSIQFKRVRWHQYTAKYNCTADQVKGCYFSLVEVAPSRALQSFLNQDKASARAYKELHHFRIFLDEEGCHELFAESASASDSFESDALQTTRVASGAQVKKTVGNLGWKSALGKGAEFEVRTVYDLLDVIARKPGVFIGASSITALYWTLVGFELAVSAFQIGLGKEQPSLDGFHDFVAEHCGLDSSVPGWRQIILDASKGDEEQAFAMFYALLKTYRER